MTGSALSLASPLGALPGIGPRRAAALAAAGLRTVGDLLWHLPRAWQDRREAVPVAVARPGDVVTVRGRLGRLSVRRLPGRGRRSLVEGALEDASGRLAVGWFNQPYLAERLAGQEVVLHGRVQARDGRPLLAHPDWRPAEAAEGGLVPVYPAVEGLGSRQLRGWIEAALARLDLAAVLPDPLPERLRRRHGLPTLAAALEGLHRPPPEADAAALAAGRSPEHLRLVYGELLTQQLELALRARSVRQVDTGRRYRQDDALRRRARELLPFRLTAAQRRVVAELVADMRRPWPMRRLLQGDVGSGKTAVAALLLFLALESGYQVAFLAPTTLLAEQHFGTLRRWLGHWYPVVLLAGGRGGEEARSALADGRPAAVVGTHALLQEGVAFPRLALVVIDEQHRFGVAQREVLPGKGERVDVLVMSATPIPRSLALTVHGELDVSLLDELPPGRSPVATILVPASRRAALYRRLGEELAAGAQGYVVFPAIDEDGEPELPSLAGLGRRVGESLAGVPSAFLHGRLPVGEREAVMEEFRSGAVRLLLATTVVEVGVDVPAATAMVIEGADRYGLAQLHQLRGRVGRGERPSWCAAVHGRVGREARARLQAFARLADGFAIAEADLVQRGPGDLLGERQAGLPPLRFAELPRDEEWLVRARDDARAEVAREEVEREEPQGPQ